MADESSKTNHTGKAALVIDYTVLPKDISDTWQWSQRFSLGEDPLYIPTAVWSPAALASARHHQGPSWPLNDPQIAPAVVSCLPVAQDSEPAGPMAWPLLTLDGLAEYLDRYNTDTIYDALARSGHKTKPVRLFPAPETPKEDHVRVLRVIEYTGPRALVERQVARSLHGTRGGIRQLGPGAQRMPNDMEYGPGHDSPVQITAVTLQEYPEVIARAKPEAASAKQDRFECALHSIADLDATTRARNVGRPEAERTGNIDTAMAIAREALGLDTPPAAVPQSPAPADEPAAAEVPHVSTDPQS